MGIENAGKVDIVAVEANEDGTSRLVLVISDAGQIADPAARYEALRAKLRAYAEFIAEEQYKKAGPNEGKMAGIDPDRIAIRVMHNDPVTEAMRGIKAIRFKREADGRRFVIPVEFKRCRI